MAEDQHHQDTVQSLQYEIELLKTRISQEREKLKVRKQKRFYDHRGSRRNSGLTCVFSFKSGNSSELNYINMQRLKPVLPLFCLISGFVLSVLRFYRILHSAQCMGIVAPREFTVQDIRLIPCRDC